MGERNRNVHVCYFAHTSDLQGGGERCLLEMIRCMQDSAGCRITLIAPPGPLMEHAEASTECLPIDVATVRRTSNPVRLGTYALQGALGVIRLRRALRRLRPDVVHANSGLAGLYAGLAAWGIGIPVITHQRDLRLPHATFRLMLPFIARRAARTIAVCKSVKENLCSFGVPEERVTVIYDGIRPPRPGDGDRFRHDWRVPGNALVIAVIGQLLERKGQLSALRAFARVRAELSTAHLVFCGGNLESPYARAVRTKTEELGISDAVTFTGFQPDADPLFDALDILLCSSNNDALPRVLVEAMWVGKPVVATAVGGTPEAVHDGVNGVLVPVGDEAAMANALLALARDRQRRESLGANGRERAVQTFSWEDPVKRAALRSVYEEVTARR